MNRVKRCLGLALVIALALLPVLHSHALLTDNSAQPCAACAAGTGDVVVAPAVVAPAVLAFTLQAVVETTTFAPVARTCSTRGPPSAG
jgi:hypothetical protein